ncbi:MAG: hypothetical protein OWU33_03940 [Firmicutes bacterium]|nr:hypothetical protein [Bacillota bacterium]
MPASRSTWAIGFIWLMAMASMALPASVAHAAPLRNLATKHHALVEQYEGTHHGGSPLPVSGEPPERLWTP